MERTNLFLGRRGRSERELAMHLAVAPDAQGNHIADCVPATLRARGDAVNVGVHPTVATQLARPRGQQEFRSSASECSARPRLMLGAVVVSAQPFRCMRPLAVLDGTRFLRLAPATDDLAGPAALSAVLGGVPFGGFAAVDAERPDRFPVLVVASPASNSRVGDSLTTVDTGAPSLRPCRLTRPAHLRVLGHLALAVRANGRKRVRPCAGHARLGDDGFRSAASGTRLLLPPHGSHPMRRFARVIIPQKEQGKY
jgi:hypothetical protein